MRPVMLGAVVAGCIVILLVVSTIWERASGRRQGRSGRGGVRALDAGADGGRVPGAAARPAALPRAGDASADNPAEATRA